MSSFQRKRGQEAIVYPTKVTTDARGNDVIGVDLDSPIPLTAAFIPLRSMRAEVPGQSQINVMKMIFDHRLEGVTAWSMVDWNGVRWDVVSPPAYHHGTRHSRHLALDIRQRP